MAHPNELTQAPYETGPFGLQLTLAILPSPSPEENLQIESQALVISDKQIGPMHSRRLVTMRNRVVFQPYLLVGLSFWVRVGRVGIMS